MKQPLLSSTVLAIRAEGDELAQRIAAMMAVTRTPAFKAMNPLDAHLFTLQAETMQAVLHVLTIRLARANDADHGVLPDTASALGAKPIILKSN